MSGPGRNDPCPCGSGKKYKKCCGAAAPAAAEPRHCGECTACCDGWLKIEIRGEAVYPGKPCPFSTGHSCTIYEERPTDPCREFNCGWLLPNSPFPNEFRPDRLGLIILAAKIHWRGLPVDVIVPAGRDPEEKDLAWFSQFSRKQLRPFIYQQGEQWFGYGPPEFQQELAEKQARGEKLWER